MSFSDWRKQVLKLLSCDLGQICQQSAKDLYWTGYVGLRFPSMLPTFVLNQSHSCHQPAQPEVPLPNFTTFEEGPKGESTLVGNKANSGGVVPAASLTAFIVPSLKTFLKSVMLMFSSCSLTFCVRILQWASKALSRWSTQMCRHLTKSLSWHRMCAAKAAYLNVDPYGLLFSVSRVSTRATSSEAWIVWVKRFRRNSSEQM